MWKAAASTHAEGSVSFTHPAKIRQYNPVNSRQIPNPASSDLHHDSLTINLANPLIYLPFGDDFTIDGIEVGYGIGFASLIRLN